MDKAREEVDLLQTPVGRDAAIGAVTPSSRNSGRLAGTQIYAITRQVLKDLADVELEQRIVEILMERIETMDEEERGKFRDSLAEGGTITVQSAFDMPAGRAARSSTTSSGRYISPAISRWSTRTSDNVVPGYELETDGHKIAWSIKDYLDSLEEKFYHALYEEAQGKKIGTHHGGD
ncbi:MAG: hypothetical protein MZV70_04780 [Desulfobacterales bacterium]|nr:hypothetical protein [Desulfobacterales bacterium]